jgi:hypothetical protein
LFSPANSLFAHTNSHPSPDLAQCAFSSFALVYDQIEAWCELIADDAAQQGMSLAAMMGLVVEEMGKCGRKLLFDRCRIDEGAVANSTFKIVLAQAFDLAADARILGAPRGAQIVEIVVKDDIEILGQLALSGEALHPDAVADQQMVEGAMQRLEEGAAVGAVVCIAYLDHGVIEPLVAPGIVSGEHAIVRSHDCSCSTLGAL